MKIIRFELRNPETKRLSRLPEGVDGDKSLMMWKELCRTGEYVTDGEKHVIDDAFFERMVSTFHARKSKGIEVPCPIGHTHDPEAKRGRIVHIEIRPNDSGGKSLWGIIEFVSVDAKKALQHSDVSIDAPVEIEDGDGETHKFALEHVAFTDYPVVPGMEGFSDVSFSILKKDEKEEADKKEKFNRRFTLDALIAKMGLTENFTSPADVYEAIWEKFQELKAEDKAGTQPDKSEADDEDEEEEESEMPKRGKKLSADYDWLDAELSLSRKKKKFASDEDEEKELENESDSDGDEEKEFDNGGDDEDAEFEDDEKEFSEDEEDAEFEDDEEEKELGKGKRKSKRFSRNSGMFQMMAENRMMKIDALRKEGYITAEQSQLMKRKFCSEANIRFSLRENSNRDFQETCKILRSGFRQDYGEFTGIQNVSFSRDDFESPLVAEMRRRHQK